MSKENKLEVSITGCEYGCGAEMVQVLGFEWVKPRDFDYPWCGDNGEYSGAVAIQTNVGVLLLARIEKFSSGCDGGVRRALVKPEEVSSDYV